MHAISGFVLGKTCGFFGNRGFFIGHRYLIDFNKWEIFVNDDSTRTFMSLEVVAGGLPQVLKTSFL